MSFLFKKPKPEELVRKWKLELRKEERNLDRSIRDIDTAEIKLKQSIKQRAKAGDRASALIMAKELVSSRKAKERLYNSKAQLNSISLHLQQQLATIRVTGALAKSADVMTVMNKVINLPQLNATMVNMAREMERAGLIEEMVDDTLGANDEAIEDAADEEVEKVLFEITSAIPGAGAKSLPEQQQESEAPAAHESRLAAL
uniref:Vacuolar protein sorting 24 n=1 Tax=Mastigamoeba balamuthi TaxID=108607 RepID=E9JNZ5_MASBA|nr:vacuolar protein sorting 24 [Mastigamoeba balamuthi]|eukprot:m51a1_g7074 putative snf7 family protein (201) ;mRNA; r:213492-214745